MGGSFVKLQFSESQFRVWVTVAVCLVGWAAYWNTFSGDFVWDDASSVLLNEHIQDPSFLGQLFREDQHAFGRGQGNFYRPLVNVSFMADYAVAKRPGADPAVFPFHVTNTLWHVAAALLLLGLLTAAGAPRFVRAAVPLIYVAHPLHTEAIAYISGRADPMSAAFLFAGTPVRHPRPRRPGGCLPRPAASHWASCAKNPPSSSPRCWRCLRSSFLDKRRRTANARHTGGPGRHSRPPARCWPCTARCASPCSGSDPTRPRAPFRSSTG